MSFFRTQSLLSSPTTHHTHLFANVMITPVTQNPTFRRVIDSPKTKKCAHEKVTASEHLQLINRAACAGEAERTNILKSDTSNKQQLETLRTLDAGRVIQRLY